MCMPQGVFALSSHRRSSQQRSMSSNPVVQYSPLDDSWLYICLHKNCTVAYLPSHSSVHTLLQTVQQSLRQGAMKAYISNEHRKIVFSKDKPFPPIAAMKYAWWSVRHVWKDRTILACLKIFHCNRHPSSLRVFSICSRRTTRLTLLSTFSFRKDYLVFIH